MPDSSVVEWCFVVGTAHGLGEVRVRSDGSVVFTHGDPKWVALDGIKFPTSDAKVMRHVRADVSRMHETGLVSPLTSDRLLYHYTSSTTALQYILKNRTLRLGSFEQTNDPREAKEWLFAVVAPMGALAPGESIQLSQALSAQLRRGTRLVCFCSDGHGPNETTVPIAEGHGWKHPRMWAQYGDLHRGVVLVFDRARLLESARAALASSGQLLFGDVLYVDHDHPGDLFPFVVNHNEWTQVPIAEFAGRRLELHGDWLFFTKHADWQQERESRLVYFGDDDGDKFVPVDCALREICLGEEVPAAQVEEYLAASRALGCTVSRVTWRNGLPIRHPVG